MSKLLDNLAVLDRSSGPDGVARRPEGAGVYRRNTTSASWSAAPTTRFDGVAGFYRRKQADDERARLSASMRPPEFTGGNSSRPYA